MVLIPKQATFVAKNTDAAAAGFADGDLAGPEYTMGALGQTEKHGTVIFQLPPSHAGVEIGGDFGDLLTGQ